MWRCANDFFGYCSSSPDFGKPPKPLETSFGGETVDTGAISNGECKLDPVSCGHHRSETQLEKEAVAQHA